MLFPTIDFAVFFALVFPITWWLNRWNFLKKVWLVAASYAFYSFWSPWLLGLLFFSATLNFLIGLSLGPIDRRGVARAMLELGGTIVVSVAAVSLVVWLFNDFAYVRNTWSTAGQILFELATSRRFQIFLACACLASVVIGAVSGRRDGSWRKRTIMTFAVIANLSLLGFYKYYNFFSATLSNLFSGMDFGTVEVALPIAISFLTFHGLSYVIDVYRQRITPSASIVDILLYISFFPHLVAGPIVRAHDFVPQLQHRSDPATIDVGKSVFLILGGLFKKVVIASHVSTLFVDPIFVEPTNFSTFDLIFGMYAYAIVIYCDFSAYTDIAIGIANLLGYKFPQNFNQPYRAVSLQDFWRRWHITLSTWLRDYLYIPLGGNRHGTFATYRNLILTMTLGGLWHGAGMQFIIWGLMHGAGLAAERLLGLTRREREGPLPLPLAILAWFVTFHFVCIAWVFFRSPSLAASLAYFGAMWTNTALPSTLTWFVGIWMILGFATQWISPAFVQRVQRAFEVTPLALKVAVPFATIYAIAVMAPAGVPPFIYFQF